MLHILPKTSLVKAAAICMNTAIFNTQEKIHLLQVIAMFASQAACSMIALAAQKVALFHAQVLIEFSLKKHHLHRAKQHAQMEEWFTPLTQQTVIALFFALAALTVHRIITGQADSLRS